MNLSVAEAVAWIAGGVVGGMAAGALLMLLVRTLHRREVRKLVGSPSPEDYRIEQTRVLNLPTDPETVLERGRWALRQLPRAGVLEENARPDELRMRTTSFPVAAEVSLRVKATTGDSSEVTISSRPVGPLKRFDLGVSLRNVLEVEGYVMQAD